MQKFVAMNEFLLFKDAFVLFKFNIPRDKKDYPLSSCSKTDIKISLL